MHTSDFTSEIRFNFRNFTFLYFPAESTAPLVVELKETSSVASPNLSRISEKAVCFLSDGCFICS